MHIPLPQGLEPNRFRRLLSLSEGGNLGRRLWNDAERLEKRFECYTTMNANLTNGSLMMRNRPVTGRVFHPQYRSFPRSRRLRLL
jgi:hypothetical protein